MPVYEVVRTVKEHYVIKASSEREANDAVLLEDPLVTELVEYEVKVVHDDLEEE